MESLFAICDIFWVSKLGSDDTAAVGLTESVLTLYYAIAIGLGMGLTAMVARRIGEKDPEAAALVTGQSILIGARGRRSLAPAASTRRATTRTTRGMPISGSSLPICCTGTA